MAEDQSKPSQFMEIADLTEISRKVRRNHYLVKMSARQKSLYRVNRIEERMQELYDDGTIMVDTSGSVIGQINGLP
jgi:predicted ATP-dependent protease